MDALGMCLCWAFADGRSLFRAGWGCARLGVWCSSFSFLFCIIDGLGTRNNRKVCLSNAVPTSVLVLVILAPA